MAMISVFLTGIGMFLVGAALVFGNRPLSDKEQVKTLYEELEFQAKKDKLTPVQNADINLFGLLRY